MDATTNVSEQINAVKANSPEPRAKPSPAKRTRVLAIDDDAMFRSMVKELLETLDFDVHAIGNPVKGLELYAREMSSFDLILLDFYMPEMDGGKTVDWIRKINPNAKVILVSGGDGLRLRQVVLTHNFDGYLQKPFRADAAQHIIRHVLAKDPRPAA